MLTNEIKEFIQRMLKTSTNTIVKEQIRKHTGTHFNLFLIKVAKKKTLICQKPSKMKIFSKNWRFTDALFKNEAFQEKLNSIANKKVEAEREIYKNKIHNLNEKIVGPL